MLNESINCFEIVNLDDLKNYLKYVERIRYFMVWVDNLIFLNYGYLLLIVNVVYDEVFYFIDKEMEE